MSKYKNPRTPSTSAIRFNPYDRSAHYSARPISSKKYLIIGDPFVNKKFILDPPTIETEICEKIMNKFFPSDENKTGEDANSLFLYLSSHGIEKDIHDVADYKTDTVIDYITQVYKHLDFHEIKSIMTYIGSEIKFTSSVPSNYFGAVGDKCPDYGNKSTREWDIYVIDLYMKKMLELKNNSEITKEDLSHLFLIIRYRLRKLFESLHSFQVDIPKESSYEDRTFYRDTYKFATNKLNEIWKDYKANGYVNNKRFSFKPNPDEGDINAKYGIHVLGALLNGKTTISDSFNTVDVSADDFFKSIIPDTYFQQYLQPLINTFVNTNTESRERIHFNFIVNRLKIRKKLTLGDIFYLGWILKKKLYIFDPSCNSYNNETGTTTRSGIQLVSTVPHTAVNALSNLVHAHNSQEDTQEDTQKYEDFLGGKKKRRKTKRRKTKKRRKSIRRKRRPH